MTYAFETEGLVKHFAKGKVTALDGVDLQARAGTILGVLGPNGAGKTTAVRILSTLIRPDAGLARVGGYDVTQNPHEVRSIIGLTGQYAAVDEGLTGRQNIAMVGRLIGMSRSQARAKADSLLDRFALSDAGGRKAETYSGGMRRRLDLAVSLVGDPSVLFLDEPTTGLDPESRHELWGIVRQLVNDGSTVLLTTQYMEEVDRLADNIVVIDGGVTIASGTASELKAKLNRKTLELEPIDRGRLEEAARIVEELGGTRPIAEGNRLLLIVEDSGLPAALLRRLDDAGIEVAELAFRLPSLDEVFLSLTGRRSRKPEDPSAAVAETAESTESTESLERSMSA